MPKPPLIEWLQDNDRTYVADDWDGEMSKVKFHREDGPAHEDRNGQKWWYVNGVQITRLS